MIKTDIETKQALHFRFDVSTFRLLGRELITDRITALFELVKNSYDANAENVYVEFYNVGELSDNSSIIIKDDGIGMTLDEIRDKWMVIGTNNKRRQKFSDPPYKRILVGEKGIGRFAVDKLGPKLVMQTKKKDNPKAAILEIDWGKYEELSKQYDTATAKVQSDPKDKNSKMDYKPNQNNDHMYFTDIDNRYWFAETEDFAQGTTLNISPVRNIWTKNDIERAYKELAKLVSPIKRTKYPFNIFIKSNEYEEFKEIEVASKAIQHETLEIDLGFDKKKKTQDVLDTSEGKLNIKRVPIMKMGPVGFRLYYFDQKAKGLFKKDYKGGSIDGIKIYRDGLITTPFAEYEAQDEKKRDILGIDKRRYSGFFERLSSRDLIGVVDITKEDNPYIVDATNRQDFVDHPDYRELKAFIIEQIIELEKHLKSKKEEEGETTKSQLKSAKEDLKVFTSAIKKIAKEVPQLKEHLTPLEKQAKRVEIDVKKGIKAYNELEKEKTRQENIFLSLMSLQEYAAEISHVVRTSLGKIKRFAEFFKNEFPNKIYNDIFKKYAKKIYEEMKTLDKAVDFMLSYARSNTGFEDINIKTMIESLFNDAYKTIFEKENIKTLVEISDPLIITHNRKFFEDIIENLIANSVKALKGRKNKVIKCTGIVENDKFILYFSDNGPGIDEEDKARIFNIYFTKTAEQGGAGLGLFIVKTRIASLKGTVEVAENELKPTGATLKITLPFKKEN